MAETQFLTNAQGRRIAYHQTPGQGPGVVFLGGFMSDMQGTKATHLEDWCRAQGRAYLRFDYSGHGESNGNFTDGCIGDWAQDAEDAISLLTEGPQILVGSSMGGWISLLMCARLADRVAGLVTIAAAPDFTEDSMWAGFDDILRAKLMKEGRIAIPSDYGSPYPITRRLIEDGRDHLLLDAPIQLPFPVRFLQGTADTDVTTDKAMRLLEAARGADIRLTLVKGADHRFSTPECLDLLTQAIAEVSQP
ncbi:alpha/beta hydrolase [Pseudooceanicola aestuarii]|uniref:alpha/beta hydrolase n=1 Tax=Pseudooceanicola aestuarii TaxID=2697319 RepID=UPI0013D6F5A8|nr:alpha/beta hydrolase [Pseudooceanicola aestuarii]